MGECVVVGCEQKAVVIVGKPTPWGAWEYWVCADHKAQADNGAAINDNPDGHTITLRLQNAGPNRASPEEGAQGSPPPARELER